MQQLASVCLWPFALSKGGAVQGHVPWSIGFSARRHERLKPDVWHIGAKCDLDDTRSPAVAVDYHPLRLGEVPFIRWADYWESSEENM
jgi:hypothetical protein